MASNRWMKKEGEREKEAGTKGSFTRIAEEHGHTVPEEAHLDEHKPGKVGKKARMALAFESAARNR